MAIRPNRTPSALSSTEKALFRRISRDLQTRGTFDQTPLKLLIDYVQLDTRITRLNEMIDGLGDDPKLQLGAMRQLEAAATQRQQLANNLGCRS